MSYVKCTLGVVGALGLLAATQQAQAVTLQDLITAGGQVVHGNEIYSGFVDGGSLPASDVTVNFTDSGVQFSANWNSLTPGANSSVISYTVTAAPGLAINGADLFFGGQVIINNATASVGETLTDTVNNKDYSMQVFYAGKNGSNNNLRDSVVIDPTVTSLRVVKSIDVAADSANSFASLNFVENTYSNTPGTGAQPGVPEPMSLALLPLALAGLGLRKKLAR
ncbi:MAG TPA: PEP-CTERM sorting domain-containing protein [Phycisphaerae bacterium]|nr:PEP-CTERM sorting domain-containing protein [Phycisphaerae bacterium]